MRTLTHIEYYRGRATEFPIHNLTDWHVGAKACDEKGIKKLIREIENNPHARWIGGGDYVDAICHVGDKRYQPSSQASWLAGEDDVIGVQRDRVCEMLRPIMDKCWGLVKGNHEHAALKWYGRDLYGEIVTILAGFASTPKHRIAPPELALNTNGFVRVKFRRSVGKKDEYGGSTCLDIYAAHGFGGGRLPGGDALMLGRLLGTYRCKLAMVGHRHKRANLDQTVTSPYGKGVKGTTSIAMLCGSMLGAFIKPPKGDKIGTDTYAERAGYPPNSTGLSWATCIPSALRLVAHNSVSLEDEYMSYDA